MEYRVEFRIYDESHSYLITDGFTEQINKKALKYLKSQGINAKIIPISGRGAGGGLEIGLLLRIIMFARPIINSILKSIKSKIYNNLTNYADQAFPSFKIYITYETDIATYDDNGLIPIKAGRINNEIVSIAWLLKNYLREEFTAYSFYIETTVIYKEYDYVLRLNLDLPDINKSNVGLIARFISKLSVKQDVNEVIEYDKSLLIHHALYYGVQDYVQKIPREKHAYYFKFDKATNFFWEDIPRRLINKIYKNR